MKKKKLLIIVMILVIAFSCDKVLSAERKTGRIATTKGLKLRSGPGTKYGEVTIIPYNGIIEILSEKNDEGGCDGSVWYQASYNNKVGYVCSNFILDITTTTVEDTPTNPSTATSATDGELSQRIAAMNDQEFNAYLTSEGFPESYQVELRKVHKLHPTWVFKGVMTNYTFEQATDTQDKSGNAMMNIPPAKQAQGMTGFLSTAEPDYDYLNNTFIPHDGSYWFQANRQTLQYYLDPRNFLNEIEIFMFEDLTYHPSFQTLSAIKSVLLSDYMKQYANYFDNAGRAANASPVFLAALSRQEVGTSDSNIVINGRAGVLSDGIDYTGYYNFFNIGAYSSSDPKLKSLQHARYREWNSQEKSITEGSAQIASNYINCGQYTSYFQKYNLAPTATKGTWHQYCSNIGSLINPAYNTYNSYKSNGSIESGFIFAIPIYKDMAPKYDPSPRGNPNNFLRDLRVNNVTVTNFDGRTENYTVNVSYMESITISATKILDVEQVNGVGTFPLTQDTQTFNIVVTAENTTTRTYKITVNRAPKPADQPVVNPPVDPTPTTPDTPSTNENNSNNNLAVNDVITKASFKTDSSYIWGINLGTDVNTFTNAIKTSNVGLTIKDGNGNTKTSGTLVTGDKITIDTGSESKTLLIVIFGDVNGDGVITSLDILKVQKHILGYSKLIGAYNLAANIDRNSDISSLDLLKIQKHILGYANISQN